MILLSSVTMSGKEMRKVGSGWQHALMTSWICRRAHAGTVSQMGVTRVTLMNGSLVLSGSHEQQITALVGQVKARLS